MTAVFHPAADFQKDRVVFQVRQSIQDAAERIDSVLGRQIEMRAAQGEIRRVRNGQTWERAVGADQLGQGRGGKHEAPASACPNGYAVLSAKDSVSVRVQRGVPLQSQIAFPAVKIRTPEDVQKRAGILCAVRGRGDAAVQCRNPI